MRKANAKNWGLNVWNKTQKNEFVDPAPVHDTGVIQSVLNQVQDELEDHRLAINENTLELQSNYAFVLDIDQKLSRIMERLEAIEWALRGKKQQKFQPVLGLSEKEKQVFRVLYELGTTQPYVLYRDLAKKANVGELVVSSLITSMIEKGIPVLKRYDGNRVFVKLEDLFREEQAKRNLVALDTPLSYWL